MAQVVMHGEEQVQRSLVTLVDEVMRLFKSGRGWVCGCGWRRVWSGSRTTLAKMAVDVDVALDPVVKQALVLVKDQLQHPDSASQAHIHV
jgi:hypothetical protein